MKYLLLSFLAAILFQSCAFHSSQIDYSSIDKVLSKEIVTEHIVFHLTNHDSVNSKWEETYIDWLTKKLNIEPTKKIEYYKYQDADQKYMLTNDRGNGVAFGNNLHTIWPTDNHEIVHVIVGEYIGNPPKLFTEGVAVAHQTDPSINDYIPKWGGKPIDEIVHNYQVNSRIPHLDSLLIMAQYFKYSENITYPVSGSFVKYILETFGNDKFYDFIRACDWTSSLNKIKTDYLKIYNESIESSWSNWLERIKTNTM